LFLHFDISRIVIDSGFQIRHFEFYRKETMMRFASNFFRALAAFFMTPPRPVRCAACGATYR